MSTWMEIMRVLCAQTKHYLRHASSPKETTAAATKRAEGGLKERPYIVCEWARNESHFINNFMYIFRSSDWFHFVSFAFLFLSLLPYNKLSIVSRIGFNFIFIWYNSVLFFYCSTVSYDASTNSLGGTFFPILMLCYLFCFHVVLNRSQS